jgi:Flp pilus assembly protein protease CpaA
MDTLLSAVVLVVMVLFMVLVAREDIVRRRIPNRYVLVVLFGSLILAFTHPISNNGVPGMVITILLAIVFAIMRAWGEGDTKLMLALSPLMLISHYPLLAFPAFILAICIVWSLMKVWIALGRSVGGIRSHLPLGVPISFGGLVLIALSFR